MVRFHTQTHFASQNSDGVLLVTVARRPEEPLVLIEDETQ